jgi:hypothetical protein
MHMSTTNVLAHHTAPVRAFLTPVDAKARLVTELQLEGFDAATQDSLIETALDSLMKEVTVAVFSWVPESEYAKIEQLADDDRHEDVSAIITKHVPAEKIAKIIDGIFTEGVARYKELLARKA